MRAGPLDLTTALRPETDDLSMRWNYTPTGVACALLKWMFMSRQTVAAAALATLALGCAAESPASLEDCETCDVDVGRLQADPVFGFGCVVPPDSPVITCGNPAGDEQGESFEATVIAKPGPRAESDRSYVDPVVLAATFELDLGADYVVGSPFSLELRDGALYDAASDDWIPFDSTVDLVPGEGITAGDIFDIFGEGDDGDPEDELFVVRLPFERWDLVVVGDQAPADLLYGVAGDSSIRLSAAANELTRLQLVVPTGTESVRLELEGGFPIDLEGPSAVTVDTDEYGRRYLRDTEDEDLAF
jgi:hypothetical protein